jgi:hypothetical protein
MALSHQEARQILLRMVFPDGSADDWVQDVWGLSPTLGETAARLVDVMEALTGSLSDEKLENLVQSLYQDQMND